MAQARDSLRYSLSAARGPDRGRRGRRDAGACRTVDRRIGAAPVESDWAFPCRMAPGWRGVLRSCGLAVRIDGRPLPDDSTADLGATSARQPCRGSQRAGADGRAGAPRRRRASRPDTIRRAGATASHTRRHLRRHRCGACAGIFLAHVDRRARSRTARAAPLHPRAAGTRLQRAAAGRTCPWDDSASCARAWTRRRSMGPGTADGPGTARRRGVRDACRGRRAQCHDHAGCGSAVAVDRASVLASDRCDPAEPRRRIDRHDGIRSHRVGHVESDLDRLCRALCRPGCRLRYSILRVLSRQALHGRRSASCAARRRRGNRRRVGARGRLDRGGVLRVPADRVSWRE